MRAVCFTLDDNIRFLQELSQAGAQRLDEHPYFEMLQMLHNQYGAKFQLNMFYSYEPGGFSLAQVPDCYRAQFAACASWLRLSFHSAHNDPPFPYETAKPERLTQDFDMVQRELLRIAGQLALTNTTTLHYVAATRNAMEALRLRGVRGFIAMAYDVPGRDALQYHLTPEQGALLRKNDRLYDDQTELWFLHNHMIIDRVPLDEIANRLGMLLEKPMVQLMTHEQYFYEDFQLHQPDFAQKLALCWEMLSAAGYTAVFAEDLLKL